MKIVSAPSAVKVILAIAKVTFREIIGDKVLYNIFLCSSFLLGIGWLASKLTVIRPERVILDFGLTSITLSCIAISILTGSSLLSKELEKRTMQVALSRPISRAQFITGKFVGLTGVLCLNWILLSMAYVLMLAMISDQGRALVTSILGIALLFGLVQSIVIGSLAILLSTFSTASLSVMLSTGIYLIGTNISQLQLAAVKMSSATSRTTLYALVSFLPNFEFFNLGTSVIYGLPVSWKFVSVSLLYGSVVILLALSLAGLLIQVREV